MYDPVQTRVRADLANRGRHGLMAHYLGASIAAALYWNAASAWQRSVPYLAVIVWMTVLRTVLITGHARLPISPAKWFGAYFVLVTATGGAWGGLLVNGIVYEPWTPETTMVLCMMLAIGLGGLTAAAPRADILITYEVVMWTPAVAASLWVGDRCHRASER